MVNLSKKSEVMRRYDRSSSAYDKQYVEEQEAKIGVVLQNICNIRVSLALDDGCGTGLLFVHVLSFADSIVGIDFSSNLLKTACKRAKLLPNVSVVRADADYLPFPQQTFDAAITVTVLQNTPNPSETLREMKRVCKPRSTVVVTGLKKKFSLSQFEGLLNEMNMKSSIIQTDDKQKDYVAICKTV